MTEIVRGLQPGDPLPWLPVELTSHGKVNLEAFGGLRTTLIFCATLADPRADAVCRLLLADPAAANSSDGSSATVLVCAERAASRLPLFAEFSRRFAVIWDDGFALHDAFDLREGNAFRLHGVQIDEGLRIAGRVFYTNPERFLSELRQWPALLAIPAPVLSIPGMLAPADCRALIDAWHRHGGEESGYMLAAGKDGKPVEFLDANRKRRKDHVLLPSDPLFQHIWRRYMTRLAPAMRRAFQFDLIGAERLLVGRYAHTEGGHFEKHRDWEGEQSHREFGLTVNLNDDFDGGELFFPEFPGEKHKPAPGVGLVYSGALMHRVMPVTRGERFCLLSFLFGPRGKEALDRHVEKHGVTYDQVVV